MNLLFLTPQRPYPPHQGTPIRNFHLICQLAKRHRITLLTFLEPDQPPGPGPLAHLCRAIETLPVPPRSTATRLRQMLTTRRPDMSWRLWSPALRRRARTARGVRASTAGGARARPTCCWGTREGPGSGPGPRRARG